MSFASNYNGWFAFLLGLTFGVDKCGTASDVATGDMGAFLPQSPTLSFRIPWHLIRCFLQRMRIGLGSEREYDLPFLLFWTLKHFPP